MTARLELSRAVALVLTLSIGSSVGASSLVWAQSSQPSPNARPQPRAWLGVGLDDPEIDERRLAAIEAGEPAGVLISGIVKDAPADRAGLRAGDVIIRIKGEPIRSRQDLLRFIAGVEPETWADLELLRQGVSHKIQVRVGHRPTSDSGWQYKQSWIGTLVQEVPTQLREYWGGGEDSGLLVGEVREGGPGEIGGLRPGDLILKVDGHPVSAVGEFERRIQISGVGNEIVLEVSRQGTLLDLEVEITEPPLRAR
jgi:serine protease Do